MNICTLLVFTYMTTHMQNGGVATSVYGEARLPCDACAVAARIAAAPTVDAMNAPNVPAWTRAYRSREAICVPTGATRR